MKKIAFRHVPFQQEQIAVLSDIISNSGYEALWLDPDDSIPMDCEVLMGYFPVDHIKEMDHLKWIQIPAAGAERYCKDIYPNQSIVLTNCSGAFGIAIAEYMITGILMLLRHMNRYGQQQRNHVWQYAGECRSIYGSTVTVIGMGNLGTCFAERMKAMGAYVRGVRRSSVSGPSCFDEVYTTDQMIQAVKGADIVALCLPGTAETTNLIDSSVLSAMSASAILCNTGRGYTLGQQALIQALQNHTIAGAVLDVFQSEPLDASSPLWDLPNVILTPHISGRDLDPINAESIFHIFKNNLEAYFSGKPLTHIVDRARGY